MSQEVDLIVNTPPVASVAVAPVLLLLLLTQARTFVPLNEIFSLLHNLIFPMTSLPITATHQKTNLHQTKSQVNSYYRPGIPTATRTPQTPPPTMFKPTTITPLPTSNPNRTKAFHSPCHPLYNDYTSQFPFPTGCFLLSLLLIPVLTLSHGVDLFDLPRLGLIHATFFTLFLTAMTRLITPLCKFALHCTKARVT